MHASSTSRRVYTAVVSSVYDIMYVQVQYTYWPPRAPSRKLAGFLERVIDRVRGR